LHGVGTPALAEQRRSAAAVGAGEGAPGAATRSPRASAQLAGGRYKFESRVGRGPEPSRVPPLPRTAATV